MTVEKSNSFKNKAELFLDKVNTNNIVMDNTTNIYILTDFDDIEEGGSTIKHVIPKTGWCVDDVMELIINTYNLCVSSMTERFNILISEPIFHSKIGEVLTNLLNLENTNVVGIESDSNEQTLFTISKNRWEDKDKSLELYDKMISLLKILIQ